MPVAKSSPPQPGAASLGAIASRRNHRTMGRNYTDRYTPVDSARRHGDANCQARRRSRYALHAAFAGSARGTYPPKGHLVGRVRDWTRVPFESRGHEGHETKTSDRWPRKRCAGGCSGYCSGRSCSQIGRGRPRWRPWGRAATRWGARRVAPT